MKPYLLHLHERPLTMVKFNHDGDFFITCAKDGDVALVRTETCERVGTYAPQGDKPGAIYAVDVTRDSEIVVTGGADGKLVFYKFTGEQIKMLNHGGIVKFCEFNQKPGEQTRVVTCNDKFKSTTEGTVGNRIMVWQADFQQAQPLKRLLAIESELPMKASKVKWGPFDATLVSIFEEGTVIIWDASTGEQVELIQAHNTIVTSLNFSDDRLLMVTSSKDQTAKLWAMDTYECVKTYKSDRPLNDVAISPLFNARMDKKPHILLGGGQDAKDVTTTGATSGKFEACLWHMIYEEEIGTVKGHFGPINAIAWFRDGRGFVTGGEDGYVRVHNFDPDYFTSDKFE
jgi:translation initiation factor 3 subunit I